MINREARTALPAASRHIAYTCDYPHMPMDLPDMAILPLTMRVYKL